MMQTRLIDFAIGVTGVQLGVAGLSLLAISPELRPRKCDRARRRRRIFVGALFAARRQLAWNYNKRGAFNDRFDPQGENARASSHVDRVLV
jgi:hypothetical protein